MDDTLPAAGTPDDALPGREGRHWLKNIGMASAPQYLAFMLAAILLVGTYFGNRFVSESRADRVANFEQQNRLSAEQREDNRRQEDARDRERAARDIAASAERTAAATRELRVLDLGNRVLEALRDNTQISKATQAALLRQEESDKRLREMMTTHDDEVKKLRIAVEKLTKCIECMWGGKG